MNEIIVAVNLIFLRLKLSFLQNINQKNTFNFEGGAKGVLFSSKDLQNVLLKKIIVYNHLSAFPVIGYFNEKQQL